MGSFGISPWPTPHEQETFADPMPDSVETPPLLRVTGISKSFGSFMVLRGVDFELRAGERHVLAGENGAGKSTLIKILAGVHTEFQGRIEMEGYPIRPHSPLHANELGIAAIHQELSLINSMSVADNLFLGRLKSTAGFVHSRQQERKAAEWMGWLGIDIDVRRPVKSFPMATRQCIEIAKALSRETKALIMDEPTSALREPEVERLFELINRVTDRGCGVIYISHKMEEIERIADRITVLRDGQRVGTSPVGALPKSKLIQWMVGRPLRDQYIRKTSHAGGIRLRVENLTVRAPGDRGIPRVRDLSLEARRGEVLGIGGLQGSGASELLLALFGGLGTTKGRIRLDNEPYIPSSPRHAIDRGVALLTNDRKGTGLILPMSIIANASLPSLRRFTRRGWMCAGKEREETCRTMTALKLQAASLDMPARALSGGNQQKVVIAKWLQTGPRLLLLDEPTRGVDVGAKHEIYGLIEQWTASGIAILLITSEMPELLSLSDRIVVMHRGALTAEFDRSGASAERILSAAMGS